MNLQMDAKLALGKEGVVTLQNRIYLHGSRQELFALLLVSQQINFHL